jgi:hypothetical protein
MGRLQGSVESYRRHSGGIRDRSKRGAVGRARLSLVDGMGLGADLPRQREPLCQVMTLELAAPTMTRPDTGLAHTSSHRANMFSIRDEDGELHTFTVVSVEPAT